MAPEPYSLLLPPLLLMLLAAGRPGPGPGALAGPAVPATPCRRSEFLCDTGQCIALDKVCDGRDDCPDKSDELPFCSPCNRTYYGDVDQTYDLEIRRPREDRLPFVCHLNFTAAGGEFGDLVQLTFDTFTVGQFVSFTEEGCPDGHMSVREEGRPPTGGQWCGSAWGYTVYYSETRSLNLTLELRRLSEQGIGYNFDFKLAYKFLKRSSARLRYGNSTVATWRGDLVPSTYCDRVLEHCDARPCRVQSPNYPGVYPRNASCRYLVQQRNVPPDKHALIAVRQRYAHKVHIKDQVLKYDREQRVLKVWDQCNVVQDYLTVYDGGSSDSPVLVRMCGGDAVPEIVSSGPRMLLDFHTSPFDSPFHPAPLSYLPGFELEVQVLFVDARSATYVKDPQHCEFHITSFESTWGMLENPRHSLPPNTTCRYHFQGKKRETVWLSFVKYHAAATDPTAYDAECNARMRVWDGRYGVAASGTPGTPMGTPHKGNASLLGEFCKDAVPRLCAHALLSNTTRTTRPCSPAESYVSTAQELTLEQFLRQGSALYPLVFALRYEFVDTALEGAHDKASANPCDRVFKSSSNAPAHGHFQAPRSVFFYGRGGAQNLSCIFRFEAAPGERVKLTLTRGRFGSRPCSQRQDARTGRWECESPGHAGPRAELWVSEYPWPGVPVARDCLCSRLAAPVVIGTLTSPVVEVNFTVSRMNITQDYNDFHFEGEYEFIGLTENSLESGGPPGCAGVRATDRRMTKNSGEVTLRRPALPTPPGAPGAAEGGVATLTGLTSPPPPPPTPEDPDELTCVHPPWLIEPEDLGHFIYLKVRGKEMPRMSSDCRTKNRVLVRPGLDSRKVRVFCPAEPNSNEVTELFSEGWEPRGARANGTSSLALLSPLSRALVVELVQREESPRSPGPAPHVSWMQVSRSLRPAAASAASSSLIEAAQEDCPYRCPELNACIPPVLWCDGVPHCRSGFDEDEANCALQLGVLGVPTLYMVTGAGALGVLLFLVCVSACVRLCRHRKKERPQHANNKMNGPIGPLHPMGSMGGPIGPMGPMGPMHPMGPYGPMGGMAPMPSANNHHHLHVNHLHSNGDIKTATLTKRYPGPPEDFYFDGKDSLC